MKYNKIIRFFSLLLCLMLLSSCTSPNGDIPAKEKKEYPLSGELEGGGRWFFAESSGYYFAPMEGTEEREIAELIKINTTLVNGEKALGTSGGTIIKIEYDGEIFLPSGETIPIISTVYSMTREPFPFVSGDVTYMVSYNDFRFDWDSDNLKSLCINRKDGTEHVHSPYLFKAESMEELHELFMSICTTRSWDEDLEQVFKEFCGNKYNEEFFKSNILLLTCFTSSSGGDDYELKDIKIADGKLTLEIVQTSSGVTCDLGSWSAVVSVPRDTAKKINEYEAVNGWQK